MEQGTLPDFLVIDDDPVNNIICTKVIQLTITGAAVKTFTVPEKGLDYILATYSVPDTNNAVLFLDINMPSLTGWEVLEAINNFPEAVKARLKIFMLSSSVDPLDKERADNCTIVTGYIPKSLSQSKLRDFFPGYVNGE